MSGKIKLEWDIHYVTNGTLTVGNSTFPKYICDAHTHGLNKLNHPELQLVLDYGPEEVARLINAVGIMIRKGKTFKNGDKISGLYEDCDVYIRETDDVNGKPLLRLVIPDSLNRLPENATEPYSLQMMSTRILYAMGSADLIHDEHEEPTAEDNQILS